MWQIWTGSQDSEQNDTGQLSNRVGGLAPWRIRERTFTSEQLSWDVIFFLEFLISGYHSPFVNKKQINKIWIKTCPISRILRCGPDSQISLRNGPWDIWEASMSLYAYAVGRFLLWLSQPLFFIFSSAVVLIFMISFHIVYIFMCSCILPGTSRAQGNFWAVLLEPSVSRVYLHCFKKGEQSSEQLLLSG